ncbi:CS domain-containing protein [Colletotrichum higginsianum IMI 349063]|uniref:CS domain-containing protein n=2 Tax=Colletotrichum higginsianum (strain IMI 349063) TaxID=759273 RepID=A0A1B7YHP6_COLHI|nr:CS domain-containing protein [Colletotrichum higginsianum IMI 349063]OBR11593.1 CS domain-containing protein [Colletotrichum higginsianum IMI 349063]
MSEYAAGQAGMDAVEAKNWPLAIEKLSVALKSTKSPKWFIGRSKAYIATKDYKRALRDAELAQVAAAARGNRAFITDAQYRRAVAHFRLGELANADACATWAQRLTEGKSMSLPEWKEPKVDGRGFATATKSQLTDEITAVRATEDPATSKFGALWNSTCALRLQILGALEKLAEDDEKRKVTVKYDPGLSLDAPEDEAEEEEITKEEVKAAAAAAAKKPEVQKDVRVDFFQSNATMSVSVFAKNIPKDEFKVEYDAQEVVFPHLPNVSATGNHCSDRPYSQIRMTHIPGHEPLYTIPLWGQIDPAGSKHTVTANKIEFSLKKLEAGKWPTLQRSQDAAPAAPKAAAPAATPATPSASTTQKPAAAGSSNAPAYPTSSKSGPKNWDKLEGIDDDDEKDINAFFKTLYKGATPEQQRAMMKSFTESNGTALSTDWDDVKARKVDTMPPEGVEAKKWES